MIPILLVKQIPSLKGNEEIYKNIELPFMPHKDFDLEYEKGWALDSINYIYLMLDGSLEIGLQSVTDKEANDLVNTGNWRREY